MPQRNGVRLKYCKEDFFFIFKATMYTVDASMGSDSNPPYCKVYSFTLFLMSSRIYHQYIQYIDQPIKVFEVYNYYVVGRWNYGVH